MFSAVSPTSPPEMNRLTPSMCQVPSRCAIAFALADSYVGTRVGLGQHHGRRPAPLEAHRSPPPLFVGAFDGERVSHRRVGGIALGRSVIRQARERARQCNSLLSYL
jgi:hypothetical protein